MTPGEFERCLHAQIQPGDGVYVVEASDLSVALDAPGGVNVNHQSTAFGSSLSALAILWACSLLHLRLNSTSPRGLHRAGPS